MTGDNMKVAGERDILVGKDIEICEGCRRDDARVNHVLAELKLDGRRVREITHVVYHMFDDRDTDDAVAAAASAYAACRIVGIYRPVRFICEAAGIGKTDMMRGYRQIKDKARKWDGIEGAGSPFTLWQALDYILDRLGLLPNPSGYIRSIVEKAREIIQRLEDKGVGCGSKTPCMVAAASVYIAAPFFGSRYSQQDIARAIDPNPSSSYYDGIYQSYKVGIKDSYRWICDELDIDFEVKGNKIYVEGEKL